MYSPSETLSLREPHSSLVEHQCSRTVHQAPRRELRGHVLFPHFQFKPCFLTYLNKMVVQKSGKHFWEISHSIITLFVTSLTSNAPPHPLPSVFLKKHRAEREGFFSWMIKCHHASGTLLAHTCLHQLYVLGKALGLFDSTCLAQIVPFYLFVNFPYTQISCWLNRGHHAVGVDGRPGNGASLAPLLSENISENVWFSESIFMKSSLRTLPHSITPPKSVSNVSLQRENMYFIFFFSFLKV